MDFSAGLLDFLPKKSFFAQKARKDFFRESDGFFRGRIWQFWWIRAHSFLIERWKSQIMCACVILPMVLPNRQDYASVFPLQKYASHPRK